MLKTRIRKKLRQWLTSKQDTLLEVEQLKWLSSESEMTISKILNYAEYMQVNSSEPMISFAAQMIGESGQRLRRVNRAFCALQKIKAN